MLILEDIAAKILENADTGYSVHYLFDDLRAALEERKTTIDLDKAFLEQLYEAVDNSEWIPPEYFTNDWMSDAAHFLKTGEGIYEEDSVRGSES